VNLKIYNQLHPFSVQHQSFTMAERSMDRAPSISSSITEAEAFDENEKASSLSSTDGSFTKLKSPEDMEVGDDIERTGLLPAEEQQEKPQPVAKDNSMRTAGIWMVVNTLATIGIVSLAVILIEVLAN
jgi:solute carrier family 35, member E3